MIFDKVPLCNICRHASSSQHIVGGTFFRIMMSFGYAKWVVLLVSLPKMESTKGKTRCVIDKQDEFRTGCVHCLLLTSK